MHVFISGAGPVGLSAAVALLGRGHRVTIVDRDAGITQESKAVAVNANSLQLLASSGVAQRILAAGEVVRTLRVLHEGSPFTRIKIPGAAKRWPTIVALPQSATEAQLEARLGELGGSVLWSHEVTGVAQDKAGIRAVISDRGTAERREITADYALGADGSRSTTREALGIAFAGRAMPEDWSLADVTCDWPWPEQACGNFTDHHDMTFMITIGSGRHRLIGNHPDVVATAGKLMTVREVHWANPFNVHLRVAETMGKGRVCLAGDAAHTHSPVGGRGMNLGIADAFAFADAVDSGDLDGYRAARLPAARRVVKWTDRAYRRVTTTSAPALALRNVAVRGMGVFTRMLA